MAGQVVEMDEEEATAWRAFLLLQRRLMAQLGQQLQASTDLSTADYEVLATLAAGPGAAVRVFELASGLEWERSRLSHQLTRMERRGLVRRAGCPDDRRGALVELTPAGQAAVEGAAPGYVEAVRQLFLDALTPEDRANLDRIASRVLARLPAAGTRAGGC